MKALYMTSAETFSGKSALCIGLGLRFRKDGFKVGYMKPVNVNCQVRRRGLTTRTSSSPSRSTRCPSRPT